MRRRLEHQLTVGIFVSLILAPAILGVVGLRASAERENRPLLDWPALSIDDALDSERYSDIEAFLTDHLPLRQESAAAINRAIHAVTGESPVEDAFVDSSGVWNLSEDFLDACIGNFRADELAERVESWEAASNGTTDIVIAVAPDKSSILIEDFGARNRLADTCQVQREQMLRDAFATSDDLLDLWSPLRARAADDEDRLFFRNDSHWTSSGAISMADAVVELFSPGLFDPSDLRPTDEVIVTGDVTRRLGWEEDEATDRLVAARESVTTEVEVTPSTSGQGVRTYSSVSTTPGRLVPGSTVVVHDSMGNYAEGMLAPYFERVQFVNWNDLAAGEFLALVPSADRIVFETVQRAMYPRVDDPLLAGAFDDAMRNALAPD
jgi:hypothetical protein